MGAKDKKSIARKIVEAFLADITDRRGFAQPWGELDSASQAELLGTWEEMVEKELLAYVKTMFTH